MASAFKASFQPMVVPVMLARFGCAADDQEGTLSAAWSSGKVPTTAGGLADLAFNDSIAFVVYTTRLMSGGKARNGQDCSHAWRHSRMTARYYQARRTPLRGRNSPQSSASVSSVTSKSPATATKTR
jgi:hypothetical protein